MPSSDAFALKNSGLNEFLLAEVGNEVNGSPLTILSVLARLGKDPWTEAGRLARLPKAAVIDYLANSISQMPLSQQSLTDARATATRLILLLPSQVPLSRKRDAISARWPAIPRWVPIAVVFAALAFGIAWEMFPLSTSSTVVAPLTNQPVEHAK